MNDFANRLEGLSVSLVGPGRVGSSLGTWLHAAGATFHTVLGREPARTQELAKELACESAAWDRLPKLESDLVLLTVADGAIAEVARRLRPALAAGVVVHVSGRLGPSVLAPLRDKAAIGCWHPLRVFPDVERDPQRTRGMVLAIDGEPAALTLAERVGTALDFEVVRVPEAVRDQYHLAATIAAGGVASSLVASLELANRLGLPAGVARGFCALARGAVDAVQRLPMEQAAAAITGPAARGELSLVDRLRRLVAEDPQLGSIAVFGALATVRVRRVAGLGAAADEGFESQLMEVLRQSGLP